VTAEARPLTAEQFAAMHRLAERGVGLLLRRQREALGLEA
jgi:hypothetical protein